MGMKLPDDINVITDVFGETLAKEGSCFCADASLGGHSAALQIVLIWSVAPSLARCHGGRRHLSLKFDFVFVPVTVFPFIDLLNSDQCNSKDVSFSMPFVGNAGHFDAVIDLAGSEGLEGLLEIQASRILESCSSQTFDNEINLAGSESLEGLKLDNIKPQHCSVFSVVHCPGRRVNYYVRHLSLNEHSSFAILWSGFQKSRFLGLFCHHTRLYSS